MTPVGVFFICQNEDKCHFVNSTILRRKNAILGVSAPSQIFSDGGKIFLYHDGRAVNRGPLLWLWQSYLLWRPVYC